VSAAASWSLLLGSVLVPMVLLWTGLRLHRRPAGIQAAFRGGTLGYLAGVLVVTTLLVVGPHHWPPTSTMRLWAVVLSLPLFTLAGAGLALLGERR
jgi:p-aminobenzoyl-glutamate transporter AbgT